MLIWDVHTVRILYPLIAHLPTVLVLSLILKAGWGLSVISVAVSYSMCQLLRWIGLVSYAVIPLQLAAVIIHLALCLLILAVLDMYCLSRLHSIIGGSKQLSLRFGALPVLYYLYEYFMLYTQQRYVAVPAFQELLPTAMVLFFVLFASAYASEAEQHRLDKGQKTVLEAKLTYAQREIEALRMLQDQTAVYRHDLRHHLRLIDGLLCADKREEAQNYIRCVESEIESIVPVRYCENETVNLLLGAFSGRAKEKGIFLFIRASLPGMVNIPDTELCAMISNGIENAINAVSLLADDTKKQIDFLCCIRQSNLLIEIKNPYAGEIVMRDHIPLSKDTNHGYGCRSILYIAQRRKGVCSFETDHGVFVLRIAIPLQGNAQ